MECSCQVAWLFLEVVYDDGESIFNFIEAFTGLMLELAEFTFDLTEFLVLPVKSLVHFPTGFTKRTNNIRFL